MSMHTEHMHDAAMCAYEGGRVAVFSHTLDAAQAIFSDIAYFVEGNAERITRTNGRQSITFPSGGRVTFHSLRSSGRGMSVDRAYVPIGTESEKLAEIIPMLATSKDGVLTGY